MTLSSTRFWQRRLFFLFIKTNKCERISVKKKRRVIQTGHANYIQLFQPSDWWVVGSDVVSYEGNHTIVALLEQVHVQTFASCWLMLGNISSMTWKYSEFQIFYQPNLKLKYYLNTSIQKIHQILISIHSSKGHNSIHYR